MRPLEYHFECEHKRGGRCTLNGMPGCDVDCERLRCAHCIHRLIKREDEPCTNCFVKLKEEEHADPE